MSTEQAASSTRDRCINCGQDWEAHACGPSHALIADYVHHGERRERAKCRARCRELIVKALFAWNEANLFVPPRQAAVEAFADRLLAEEG